MTTIQFCPNCKVSLTLKSILARTCPECGSELSTRMREKAQRSMAPPMPFAMQVGMWLSLLFGVGFILMTSVSRACTADSYTVGDRSVTRDVFLEETRFTSVAFVLLGIAFLVIAWTIRARKSWSRIAVMAFWVVYLVLTLARGQNEPRFSLGFSLATWAIYCGIAAWYFFAKRNVTAYFRSLASAEN